MFDEAFTVNGVPFRILPTESGWSLRQNSDGSWEYITWSRSAQRLIDRAFEAAEEAYRC